MCTKRHAGGAARALAMVNNLIAALDARLHTLEWMTTPRGSRRVVKLRAFSKKIGYPTRGAITQDS